MNDAIAPRRRAHLLRNSLLAALLALLAAPAPAARARSWEEITAPSSGAPRAIGTTTRGCLAGGIALPTEATGFATLRRWRNRYYGTAELILFIKQLGESVTRAKLPPLLIGDTAQPRGGPLPYGHASHQTGIDADILFTPGPMSAAAREALKTPPSMLEDDGETVSARFGATQLAYLKLVVADPRTARVFVNFHLKKYLCESQPANQRAWLHKLRPWLGHDEHFHVRLVCPPDSQQCVDQDPIPAGDGCDDSLEAWFQPPPSKPSKPTVKPPKPVMPAACQALLKQP